MWTEKQINDHKKVARELDKVMKITFNFIRQHLKNVTEFEVQKFILKEFDKRNLESGKKRPIVAFNRNTSCVHYFPKKNSLRLSPESLIMIDIWARINKFRAPFADITWVAYCGKKMPKKVVDTFKLVRYARDKAASLIQTSLSKKILPTGKVVDDEVRKVFEKNDIHDRFLHGTGHSLGFLSAHGRTGGNLRQSNNKPLRANVGYTIEPGLYYNNFFGIRSEIDFYISNKLKLVITTDIQKKIIKM